MAYGLPDSSRVEFRRWEEEDLDFAARLWGDPKVTDTIFPHPLTRDQAHDALLQEIECELTYGYQYWPMYLKADGTPVGSSGLRPYDLANNTLELGFFILPELWGRGLASEGARGVVNFAFEQIEVDALYATHSQRNLAAERIVSHLGFRYSHSQVYAPTGEQCPSYLLTAENFSPR